jgi:hypothetical protein
LERARDIDWIKRLGIVPILDRTSTVYRGTRVFMRVSDSLRFYEHNIISKRLDQKQFYVTEIVRGGNATHTLSLKNIFKVNTPISI